MASTESNGINHNGSIMQGGPAMKNFNDAEITKYALFLGGTNVAHDVLEKYDPLKTGYGRLFMVRKPIFVDKVFGDKGGGTNMMDVFKHILEYGNTAVSGLNDVNVEFESLKGGYVGKSFEIPTYAQDNTNSFSVKVYEFSGSPIREVLHTWINGTTDLLTGLTTYHGYVNDGGLAAKQSNQTAEFIYVATDNTGENVEYACFLANCFPKQLNTDVFNYESGSHGLVETTIEFTCTKYESIHINKVACALLERYKMLANSLNFYSGITYEEIGNGKYYNVENGQIVNRGEGGGESKDLKSISASEVKQNHSSE
jgi:hypothetical protein